MKPTESEINEIHQHSIAEATNTQTLRSVLRIMMANLAKLQNGECALIDWKTRGEIHKMWESFNS